MPEANHSRVRGSERGSAPRPGTKSTAAGFRGASPVKPESAWNPFSGGSSQASGKSEPAPPRHAASRPDVPRINALPRPPRGKASSPAGLGPHLPGSPRKTLARRTAKDRLAAAGY